MRVRVVQHRDRRRAALRRRVLWSGGELLVTAGVLVLLLVLHQLWWTNREARAGAERKVQALEREWKSGGSGATSGDGAGRGSATAESGSGAGSGERQQGEGGVGGGREPSASSPRDSQAYAVIVIPRLRLRAPVAEGTSKRDVLNKGYVGHYRGTQQPGQAGNFAVAGHRNTHGEPFRYLNRLRVKDIVEIETASTVYTYTVGEILPQTSARDSGVLRPVPRSVVRPSYGYTQPGHYITLTTCTPEYTSRYRLVVWGTLTSARPR